MCVRASMKAAKPLHIVLATNPNPTRARGYPLNINPKPDPKPDSISGPAGSGRVADLYCRVKLTKMCSGHISGENQKEDNNTIYLYPFRWIDWFTIFIRFLKLKYLYLFSVVILLFALHYINLLGTTLF